jgi:hypothetical protein
LRDRRLALKPSANVPEVSLGKPASCQKQLEKGAGNQYASPRGAEKQKALAGAGISTQ